MSPSGEAERKLAQLSTWLTALICFVLVFVISIMAVVVWQSSTVGRNAERLEEVATQTHDTLCAFKRDLEVRYDNGAKFLKENPEGIPGISAAEIQRSLSNQKSTLESLSNLDCS